LAFQLERWYAEQRLRSNVQERLVALSVDFSINHDVLDRGIEVRTEITNATLELLKMDEQSTANDDYDEFYRLLASASRISAPQLIRGTYDSLVSSGEVELFDDELLKLNLAEFYAGLDEFLVFQEATLTFDSRIFEPFVINNLDHVQMLHYLHPDHIRQTMPTQDSDAFLKVLGTSVFKGVISGKWHRVDAEFRRMQELREQAVTIEEQIAESLRGSDD
jgi:hypothetical protein